MLTEKERSVCAHALEQAAVIQKRTLRKGCFILTPDMQDYPHLLRQIYARPAVLYGKGTLEELKSGINIAMVGTRKHSEYGRRAAELLAQGLADAGVTVVSGLAKGIDQFCHRMAVESSGCTVGVLGCGLDMDYPKGSSGLKTAMVEHGGAVVTEYPLGTQPRPEHFPVRNRIISGMSHGTVVVEADLSSGSMITANHALEQGRDVFAVPGDIFSTREAGVHALLKEGAKLVDSAQDILEEYGMTPARKSEADLHNPPASWLTIEQEEAYECPVEQEGLPETLTKSAQKILEALGGTPHSVEQLAGSLVLELIDLHMALTELEIYGLVQALPGRHYVRTGARIEKV